MIAVPVPQATIIGNAAYLLKKFKQVEGGWIAYKIFNSSYSAPDEWKIEVGSIIKSVIDDDPDTTCSFGINVAKDIGWIQKFISNESCDVNGDTEASVWQVFIPDTAIIVIPEKTDGKIRVSEIRLDAIVDTVQYDIGWNDDDYDDDYDFSGDDDF